jgi:small subunit ribosomal protein S17
METEVRKTEMGKKAEIASASKDKKIINKVKSVTQGATKLSEAKLSECRDRNCHVHGTLKARGRNFEGTVIKKFHKRVVIEFERMVRVRKYERYKKSKTKIHARLPVCMEEKINVGDYIKVQECRPLSKLIHFVVIEKIREAVKK